MKAYKNSADTDEQNRIWGRITEISKSWDSLPKSVLDAIFILRQTRKHIRNAGELLIQWE